MSQERSTARIEDLLVHADWLRRMASSLVYDHDPDDLVQETFTAAMRSPPTADRPTEPWLATVLRNLARRRWRDDRVRAKVGPALVDDEATAPPADQLLERAQLQRQLAELVVRLDEPYRTALLLRYYEGQSAADIARRLNIPAGTVRWRLSEGIERLRRGLDDRHGGDRKAWKALLAPFGAAGVGKGALRATPATMQGGSLMALGTKAKLGIAVAALGVIALGVGIQRWQSAKSLDGGAGSAAARSLPRGGLPALSPGGSATLDRGAVDGVVTDADGRPVPGALIALSSTPAPDIFDPRRPTATTNADGQGRFRLDGVPAGEHRVSATAAGLAPARSVPFDLAPREEKRLALKMAAGGQTLQGRVLDDGGGPIAGARVIAWAGSSGSAIPIGPASLFQVTTDAEGHYSISLSPREYTVRAEAGGYAPTETTIPVTRDLRRDLRLHPAARISGRVLERESRQPVADARVTLTPTARMERISGRLVRTDAEGAFHIDDAESGAYQVIARSGAAVAIGHEVSVVATQLVEGVELLLDMHQQGAAVEGRVVTPAGDGVPGARVASGTSTVTGADGGFRLAGVTPGPTRIRVSTPDRGEVEHMMMVGADGARDVRIVVSMRPVLTGRVRDAAGAAVSGAQVRADPLGREARSITVETLEDGTFRVPGLPEGKAALLAWHPTLGVVRQEIGPLVAGRSEQVELRLGSGASIAGTVRFEDGSPAAAVSVAFTGQQRGGLYGSVATADDGQFRAGGLPPGKYTVRARRKAGPWNISTSVERPDLRLVTIEEGEQKPGIDLVLRRGGQSIGGSVFLPDGKPAAGTAIVANIEENGRSWRPTGTSIEHSAVAREDGTFTLEDIEAGSFTLWAARPGMPETSVKGIAAGRKDLRITLPAAATLAGVVVDGQGRPVPRFTLNVVPAAGATPEERAMRDRAGINQRPVSDPGGAFKWGGLAAGSYEVHARTADGGGAKQTAQLAEGENRSGLRLVLTSGVKVTGKVVALESGAPLDGLRIIARVAGRQLDATTDARGAFELAGLFPAEELDIRAMGGEDVVAESKRLVVPAAVSTFDAGLFRLMKADPKRRVREDGTFRMAVESREERATVTIVRPGSPADRAGIKVGDNILSIDGRDVTALGPGAIHYLLERKPGATVALVVQSPGGEPRKVTATAEAMGRPAAPPGAASASTPPAPTAAR